VVNVKKSGLSRLVLFFVAFSPLGFSSSVPTPWADSISAVGQKNDRLNVLLVTIDTLRTDGLSCYSSEYLKTPNIDSLAEKGVVFSRSFANTSTTLPSHTNILLGTNPLYHGVHENTNFIVGEEFLTLAEYLKKFGYNTGAFVGAYPLDSRFGLTQGFDIYDDDYDRWSSEKLDAVERRAEDVIAPALEWLESQAQATPWFLWIHCYDPHDPYEPPEPFNTEFEKQPYYGEVAYVDFALGKLFKSLKDTHSYENTLIIFTGDHGESLGQHGELTHGFYAYNSSIWVPLIVYFPGILSRRIEEYVSHIDIFPTVCDVLHIEKPSSLQGNSLLPAMEGNKLKNRPIYFESLFPYYSRGWAPLRGFIYEGEKFIESPIPELYDLDEDFEELKNLAEEMKLDRYRKRLEQIIKDQSFPERTDAKPKYDRESLAKLRSLGYISTSPDSKKENFGPQDDIKVLLPYNNRAMKAMDLYQQGEVREGFELLKQLLTERQDIDIAYYNLAALYEEQGELNESFQVLKLGLDNIPTSYEIFLRYITFLVKASKDDEIIKVFDEKHYRQMEHDPEIWNFLGIAHSRKQDFENAVEAYEKGISIDNEYPDLFNNLGNAYYSLAQKTNDRIFLEKSILSLQKAIELEPDYVNPYNGLGLAYRKSGDVDKAISHWEKALELKPDFDQALINLGITHMSQGLKTQALDYFNKYKEYYYNSLSPSQKTQLDNWIQKCRQ